MPATMTTSMQIMDVLVRSGSDGCPLEDLIRQCPDLTWNQIFLELDRLSRTGAVNTSSARDPTGGCRMTTGTLAIEGSL